MGRRTTVLAELSAPKTGHDDTENEDAYALDCGAGRFAVADGASTSARPEVWSRILVDSFVDGGSDLRDPVVLQELRESWRKEVWRPGLPWFAEEKLRHGAAAAFAGLTVGMATETGESEETPEYLVRAVGDSCVFHMRGTRLLLLAPPLRVEEFSRFPKLVHTDPDASVVAQEWWEASGTCRTGDVFLLATDTTAKALLHEYENAAYGTMLAAHFATRSRFDRLVSQVREGGSNDDMTACVVAV